MSLGSQQPNPPRGYTAVGSQPSNANGQPPGAGQQRPPNNNPSRRSTGSNNGDCCMM